ncbi:MAG: mechanosensitive ion channel family protein [Candidatus Solibacter usitatus]|nr:mechanosensitive ion channel family protein [Candidatus Solibacter usitatus]
MQPFQQLLSFDWRLLVVPSIALAATLTAAYAAKVLIIRALRRVEAPAGQTVANIVAERLGGPFWIWAVILGIYLGVEYSNLPPKNERLIGRTLEILWIISLIWIAARMTGNLIRHFGTRLRGATQVTSLTQSLAQLCVWCLGGSVLMHYLGISLVPILTALGVGGLAVALALQDTLSNLFAGFYVTMAGQMRPGDYIRLSTGEEGYVSDISWRSTAIRTLNNNMTIIPNAKLAQAIVTNFHLPQRRTAVNIIVNVAYSSDPDRVEQILLDEVSGATKDLTTLLADPAPNVRLIPGFGDSALSFTLSCYVTEFAEQFLVQHELRKRILRRFQQEGIEIPFPTRTLYVADSNKQKSLTDD